MDDQAIIAAFAKQEPVRLVAGKWADDDVRECYYCDGPEDYSNPEQRIRHADECPWLAARSRVVGRDHD